MILLIDNYDSFSYNLFQQAASIEPEIKLVRNDALTGSEIVGLVPMEALIDTASYYLGLENFSMQQVLEAQIME